MYVFDGAKKKLVRIARGEEPFSDIKGIHQMLLDLPSYLIDDFYTSGEGVSLDYDPITHNVYLQVIYSDPLEEGEGNEIDQS